MTKKRRKKNCELPGSLCHLFIAHSQQLLSGRLPPVRSTRCLNRLFKYFYCWFIVSGLENWGVLCGRTREPLLWVAASLLDVMGIDCGRGGEGDGGSISASPHWPLHSHLLWATSSHCGVNSGDRPWLLLHWGVTIMEGRPSRVLLTNHLNRLSHSNHYGAGLLLQIRTIQGVFDSRGHEMASAVQSKSQWKSVFAGPRTADGRTVDFKTAKENMFTVFLNTREAFTFASVSGRYCAFIVKQISWQWWELTQQTTSRCLKELHAHVYTCLCACVFNPAV